MIATLHSNPKKILKGAIAIPGSKSESNRALLLAALSPYPVLLKNLSNCDDTMVFIRFLQRCGVRMEATPEGINIIGNLREVPAAERTINLGMAGTALRFITAASCFVPGITVLDGADRLKQRVVKPLLEALEGVGAQIEYVEEGQTLPLRITGKPGLQPEDFEIDASESSQLLSALLLLAPLLPVGTTIYCSELTSKSYIHLTLHLLEKFGIKWQQNDKRYTLETVNKPPAMHEVESDWSAASYWLGLAATKAAELRLSSLKLDSPQGDAQQIALFREWGMQVEQVGNSVHIQTEDICVSDLDYDFTLMPDLAQTFAVLATWADDASEFKGLHTLPGKETDRLAGLVAELNKLGVMAKSDESTLSIFPSLQMSVKQPISTYNDHRFAMSFAILANRFPKIVIEDPEVTAKSYPDFWKHLEQVGYKVEMS